MARRFAKDNFARFFAALRFCVRRYDGRVPRRTDTVMADPVESAELLARVREGDERVAKTLFEQYLVRLTALARSRLAAKLAARVDPEDVVQSAYRSFFAGAREGRFSIERSGDLWRLLVTVTLRKLYRQVARHTAEARDVGREARASRDGDPLALIAGREPTPDEVVAVAEELEALLSSLDSGQRRVLELRLQGESLDDIARLVGRSERTVRRTLQEIRRAFAQRHGLPDEEGRGELPVRRQHGRGDARRRPATSLRAPDSENRATLVTTVARVGVAEAPLPYSDFVLEEMIGAGGMGKVYRASQRSLERLVAIKFLRKSFLSRPDAVEAFLREARTIARLQHPHVVGVHGLGRTPQGGLFIVMDLMEGGDLSRQLADGPVPHERAVIWTIQAADALAHAHERGILHCDLKPANLLLDSADRVRLTDFGLARRLRHEPLTASNIAGTAAYIAPEQVADCWGPMSPATDVHGLGAVLYHLLTGRPPYGDDRAPDVLARVVSGAMPVAPRELVPDVPCRLSDACLRCLAKSAGRRYAGMAELKAALLTESSTGVVRSGVDG